MKERFYYRVAFWVCVLYIAVVVMALAFPAYSLWQKNLLFKFTVPAGFPSHLFSPLRATLLRTLDLLFYAGFYALAVSFVITRYLYRARCGDKNDSLVYHIILYIPLLLWWIAPSIGILLIYILGGGRYENSAGEMVHFGMVSVPSAQYLIGLFFFILFPFWLRIGAAFLTD